MRKLRLFPTLQQGVLRSVGLVALIGFLTAGPRTLPADAAPAPGTCEGGFVIDDPPEVDWRMLGGLNYRTGEKTEALEEVDGQTVKIPGFTVPLEDWATTATEFLLVPYVGACVHTPPPPPNQLVYVQMVDNKVATLDGWNPVWIEGKLIIETTESVYGDTGFRVEAERVYPYTY